MSSIVYIVSYESHDDDYKGAESEARVIAAYSNKRAAYLVAAKKNLPEFLEYEIRLDRDTEHLFKKLSPEARAVVKPLRTYFVPCFAKPNSSLIGGLYRCGSGSRGQQGRRGGGR